MLGYFQELLTRFFVYIYTTCSRKSDTPETLLDPREAIVFEDYMHKKDMRELNDIFSFVRAKENLIKRKCKSQKQNLRPF